MPDQTPVSEAGPPPGLSRLQIRRALKIWTAEGSVATVQITLTTGAFQTGFALLLGCSNFVIGVLAAIPAFAGLLQLVSSFFAERYGQRKRLVPWFAFVSRLLWVPMLLIPYVLPRSLWVGAFLVLSLLSAALANVAQPLWMAWISDLVPEDNRGRYFGRRNMYAGVVGMVVSVVGGLFLDIASRHQAGAEREAFALLFGLATLFALGSFLLGLNSPDVPQSKVQERAEGGASGGALAYYLSPFADLNFRRVMIYFVALVISQAVAGQFFVVYQLKNLALNYTTFQLLAAVASLASLASMPLWGYLADKYGNKPLLAIAGLIVLVPPILWLLTAPDGIVGLWAWAAGGHLRISWTKLMIIVLNLFAGVGWAGIGLMQFNLMIGAAPAEKRTVYVSAIAAVTGIAGGIAPLVGGALLDALASVHFPAHGLVRNSYHALFLLSGVLRIGALFLIAPIQEAGSNSARYVLKQLGATKPGSLSSIRKLSRGSSARARQQAAAQLARLKTPVAVEELVQALDDVSLSVREQAAVALGEIGDARATMPLVWKLTDPASGITGAAATALGKIGDRAALPSLAAAAQLGPSTRQLAALEALGRLSDSHVTEILVGLMQTGDASVRAAAIRALAEREDPDSGPALAEQLRTEREPSALAALAEALGRVGDCQAALALLAALDRTPSPTVHREIWNAVGSIAGGRDAFYPYLALDSSARDETVSKILLHLQRRYAVRAKQKKLGSAARLSIRIRQALRAYVGGDLCECLRRLGQFGSLCEDTARAEILVALGRRAEARADACPPEEALLGVFLARQLSEG